MKVRSTEFDGTPEEFAKVAHLLPGAIISVSAEHKPLELDRQGGNGAAYSSQVTPSLVLRVLSRRRLKSNIRNVLKVLWKAGSKGLTTTEIAKAAGISRESLAGVFGAFGRRVANTPGWPQGVSFAEYAQGDDDRAEWRYWLPEVVRDVLDGGQIKL
jgi:hypothetical protein